MRGLVLLFLLLVSPAMQAQEPVIDPAIFDRLQAQGARNGEFYLNQGRAHHLNGNYPQAILAYRRALWFRPNDPELRANLAEARRQVRDPPAIPPEEGPSLLPRPSIPQLAHVALVAWVFAWLCVAGWLVQREGRWLVRAVLFLVCSAVLAGTVNWHEHQEQTRPLAVVVSSQGVVLRKGNGERYPAVKLHQADIVLYPGVEVRVRGQRPNGWMQIELANGLVGWVPRDTLLLDREPVP